jgi:hypothetical protein
MFEEDLEQFQESELSLLETLDHVLDRGIVIAGEVKISVADIDLIFIGLNVLLTSTETIEEVLGARKERALLVERGAASTTGAESERRGE